MLAVIEVVGSTVFWHLFYNKDGGGIYLTKMLEFLGSRKAKPPRLWTRLLWRQAAIYWGGVKRSLALLVRHYDRLRLQHKFMCS